MRIVEILQQNRRDFRALFECEGCGHRFERSGYDDENFHRNVIYELECPACGKSARDLGSDYRPLSTKYPAGMVV